MQKKKQTIITWAIIIIVLVIAIIGIVWLVKNNQKEEIGEETTEPVTEEFVRNLEDGKKLNISPILKEDKTFESFTISNIQLTSQNMQTELLATVKNNTEQATELTQIQVIFYDVEGKEIVTLDGIISPLEPGEETQLNISSSLDYANAYNFDIRKK